MITTLVTLLVLFLTVVIWNYSTKQKAIANAAAKAYCQTHGVDLLDDTVSYDKTFWTRSPSNRFFCLQHQYKMRYFDPSTTENITLTLLIRNNKVTFLDQRGQTQNNVIYFNPPNKQGDI